MAECSGLYREIRLDHHNYLGIINYIGRRGKDTPEEASEEIKKDRSRIYSMLSNLEERDIVETGNKKKAQDTEYMLSEEGEEILENSNKEFDIVKEDKKPEMVITEPKRTNDDGTFLHGGYFVRGQNLDAKVRVRKTGQNYLSNIPEVEVVEHLD